MPAQDNNLFSHFKAQFVANGEQELLATALGRSWRYVDIDRLSAQMASFLASIGIRPGERVSVQVKKSPENLCLYLACLRGGFIFHPLNMGYKRAELEYFIGNAEPALIVCDSSCETMLTAIAASCGVRQVLTLDGDGGGTLTESAASASNVFATVAQRRDDIAALLYSSGTTGVPKGIMLSHGNLLSNTRTLVQSWGFTDKDRLLHALPIFHVHGLFVAIGCVLLSGASMRWLPAFDAREVMKFLPECSVLMGVPTFYTRLLAEADFGARHCRSVRLFVSGSAPLLEETFIAFEERTGQRILERYGMTETNMNTSNPLHGERRPGTVGPPLPGVDVRIVDTAGNVLPTGEIGHLQVRGPNVFVGYWRMPEKTVEDFTGDGFFNTGDMARIDDDGYVSIVGRSKDVVISGGLNVYPKEIELFIDGLAGVRESAVIGVPHPDFGEGVVAIVVAADGVSPSEGEIVRACKAELADFKVPKRVVFVDELPRNTMAKVQKNLLREQCRTLFVSG
ncbi:MAG TPA: malonyl-CoA synthase [Woeseiaceae bacterium]|nr:malonyl-CoA synthase [Woeseiaceae bacterium]